MALILGIETSTPVCSVALALDGELLVSKENYDGFTHASHLTVLIQEIFNEVELFKIQDIDAVAVSTGPGSYTGLRIGISTAKGICYALDKKLIGITSLETLAWAAHSYAEINKMTDIWLCPMIDARRMEVYSAFYNSSIQQQSAIKAEIIDQNSFADILAQRKVLFFGDGANKCKNTITHSNALFIDDLYPLAKNLSKTAHSSFLRENFEDVAYLEPFYLKDFVTTSPKNKVLK